jgi:hypothetical protein
VLVLDTPRDHGELTCFVAQYGNGVAQSRPVDVVDVLLRAVTACRKDACLAKMLPVFVWRARDRVVGHGRRYAALSPSDACALGYFLELAARLGGMSATSDLEALRRVASRVREPVVLFESTKARFCRELAEQRTSELARSWNLVLGEPDRSFAEYFERMVGHGSL